MSKHDDCIKGFHHLSRAWYGETNLKIAKIDIADEVCFGFFHPDGGTTGEMIMEFRHLGGRVVPHLSVWDDGWSALSQFCDVLAELGQVDNQNISPAQFCDILLKCGFKDLTATDSPYKKDNG